MNWELSLAEATSPSKRRVIHMVKAKNELVQITEITISSPNPTAPKFSTTRAKPWARSSFFCRMSWELSLAETKSPSKKSVIHMVKSNNELVQATKITILGCHPPISVLATNPARTDIATTEQTLPSISFFLSTMVSTIAHICAELATKLQPTHNRPSDAWC